MNNAHSHESTTQAPNCWQCRHFAISWDPKVPYVCRMMGFKSRMVPSFEVFRADGNHCRGFAPKADVQKEEKVVPIQRSVKPTSRFVWKA